MENAGVKGQGSKDGDWLGGESAYGGLCIRSAGIHSRADCGL